MARTRTDVKASADDASNKPSSKKRKNVTNENPSKKKRKKEELTEKKQPSRKARTSSKDKVTQETKKKKTKSRTRQKRISSKEKGNDDVINEKEPNSSRDLELARLNGDDTHHRASFAQKMKEVCAEEDKKIGVKNSSKFCAFFTRKKYTVVVEYLQLCAQVDGADQTSGQYYELKQYLKNHCGNDKWKQFKLEGKKLMRPLPGDKKNDFIDVICLDDKETFDIINKHHWHSDPKKHTGITQLHRKVAKEFGGNITNKVCEHFVKCCDVCSYKGKKSKNKKTESAIRSGPFVFTCIDIRDMFPEPYVQRNDFDPYLLISLFQDKSFFHLSCLRTNEASHLCAILVCLFQVIGHPTSVRYYSDMTNPVNFLNQQGIAMTIDEVSFIIIFIFLSTQ